MDISFILPLHPFAAVHVVLSFFFHESEVSAPVEVHVCKMRAASTITFELRRVRWHNFTAYLYCAYVRSHNLEISVNHEINSTHHLSVREIAIGFAHYSLPRAALKLNRRTFHRGNIFTYKIHVTCSRVLRDFHQK